MAYQKVNPAQFRPRATLGLVYFFGFFFLFAFLLVAPTLWDGYQRVGADPAQWEPAQRAVQQAMRPRLLIALGLATAVTLIGGRLRLLPGTRP